MGSHVISPAGKKGAVAIACVLLLTATTGCPPPFGGEHMPPRFRAFYDLPIGEQKDSIVRYAVADQIELYLAGLRAVHPPPLHLAAAIAMNGKSVVPAVLERLRVVESDFDRSYLILILEDMVCIEGVDLRADSTIIATIKEVIDVMRIQAARNVAEGELATIADGCVSKKARARAKFHRLPVDTSPVRQ